MGRIQVVDNISIDIYMYHFGGIISVTQATKAYHPQTSETSMHDRNEMQNSLEYTAPTDTTGSVTKTTRIWTKLRKRQPFGFVADLFELEVK